MLESTVFLAVMAFIAGLINGSVGGGGLVLLPAALSLLPNELPATVFGTNKFAAIFGNGMAVRQYLKRVQLPWDLMIPAIVCAFTASFCGAMLVSKIPVHFIKPAILLMLIIMTIYTFIKKDFGKIQKSDVINSRRRRIGAAALGVATGFYDGMFGPGVGNLIAFLFIRFFAFDFLRALAASRVINTVTNLAALSFFIPSGHIVWICAIPMAAASMIGGFVGAHLMIRSGVRVIRMVFLLLMIVLIGKIAYDIFAPYISLP
ncbi:MAG: sulfite exporter TauE/SafE family protein [Burkholderiales bacterium]|jgi:uncharacterized membrane protein YfcA|nr:sulfite exporter TauE/SafE family protein [Burkholderiales bacterium]